VKEGDIIQTELWPLEVIWTPGHTEGGMCLYAREEHILFSGDTVFPDGYFGRFDGDGGSLEDLIESLRKLAKLRVEIMLPGHGTPVIQGAEQNIKLALRNAELYA
jgi:glyoxylase-like metal-dependent hydrolase (beta-lactamase superfamily II)